MKSHDTESNTLHWAPVEDFDTEDFNQIDPNVLDCFPTSKYPVNLYRWRESHSMLTQVYKAGHDLDDEQRSALRQLSEAGSLFFSRRQILEYTKSVACDLTTALDDPNLKWKEKGAVFIRVLARAQEAVFSHPTASELEHLRTAVGSLCDQLIENNRRIDAIILELHKDISPERRRVNASLVALALYLEMHKGSIYHDVLEKVALGFFLYDIGMSHVSPMMLAKKQQLGTMDHRTIREHPNQGAEILGKLDLTAPEILEPALQHHERLNGSGYPNKLKGDRIGQLGRITAIADTYAAMIADTPRRKGVAPVTAAKELIANEALYDHFICRTLVHFLRAISA